ncbi:hypothetical protein BpHYR1_000971 [Brachionus plicatilis]|uniref:Uncharacterized protein n=1 Tax=Brachionus plicatilis TaxID=10195 RepID=A0A3M7T3S0_BRAPC|nr:hypothetical protein BpHYR1_000971 [Brachionus plicatilis]
MNLNDMNLFSFCKIIYSLIEEPKQVTRVVLVFETKMSTFQKSKNYSLRIFHERSRTVIKSKKKFFQIYGVNVIYVFYGVNAHENNHVFFDVLFDVSCFSSKRLNEIKSSNRASLEQTLFTMNEKPELLNTNVSKLNSENEAIKKLIIGGETASSFFTPGTKIKVERTYINNKPFTNRLRSEIIKRFVNDKGQTLGFVEAT